MKATSFNRRKDVRKRFFIPLLAATIIILILVFGCGLSSKGGFLILLLFLYPYAFSHGKYYGKEYIKDVWRFAHPEERYNLDLIEEAMYDKEDYEYYEGKSESK